METLTSCKVLCKVNDNEKEEVIVCSEWTESKLKVVIVQSNKEYLIGEVLKQEFNKYAETFEKSVEAYMQETYDILSGEQTNIEFILQKNNKFLWKKGKWNLGFVMVKPMGEINNLKDFIFHVLDRNAKDNLKLRKLEKDNDELKRTKTHLQKQLKNCIKIKEEMECKLYKQFILLLNSKKEKLREMKKKLEEKTKQNENDIFSMKTDSESESNINTEIKSKPPKRKKLKTTSEKSEVTENERSDKKISQSNTIGEDEETPDFFLGEESECEVNLQLEDDKSGSEELF